MFLLPSLSNLFVISWLRLPVVELFTAFECKVDWSCSIQTASLFGFRFFQQSPEARHRGGSTFSIFSATIRRAGHWRQHNNHWWIKHAVSSGIKNVGDCNRLLWMTYLFCKLTKTRTSKSQIKILSYQMLKIIYLLVTGNATMSKVSTPFRLCSRVSLISLIFTCRKVLALKHRKSSLFLRQFAQIVDLIA